MKDVTFRDIPIITRIVIGCTKYVYRYFGPEDRWYNKVMKLIKPSNRELVQTMVIRKSKRGHDSDLKFIPKEVQMKFSETVNEIDQPTVSRALSQLTRVKYLEKVMDVHQGPGKPKTYDNGKIPGIKSLYTEVYGQKLTDYVTRLSTRFIIYHQLRESDVIEEFLKFHYFKDYMVIKFSTIHSLLEVEKAKGQLTEESLAKLNEEYKGQQRLLKSKTKNEIMIYASKSAKFHLTTSDWRTDELYTEFFKEGFRTYEVIESSNL